MFTRWLGRLLAVSCCIVGFSTGAAAQEIQFFSIGTGGTGATYYPLGGTIANAISNPPGSRPCEEGGSCGVPGLIAMAQSSRGSIDNIDGLKSGRFHSAFVQSDVAYWAYNGTGRFDGQTPAQELRAIAALYAEHIHLIARADSGIGSVKDLKGKRVSLDERGSGSYVNATQILEAYGLSEADLEAEFLKSTPSADAMITGDLDAFFITSGYPVNDAIELASRIPITLVPIDGPEAKTVTDAFPFYSSDTIPAGTYPGIGATETLAVGAQWITTTAMDEDLVYAITRALWNDQARRLLDVGHAKGKVVTLDTALRGIAIPLHPGAERHYKEADVLK